MIERFSALIPLLACVFAGCSSYKPNISAACEENSLKSATLKWETFPAMNGQLKVYASSNPDNIPLENPIATTSISEQMITISTNGFTHRMYYTMVFNDEYPVTVASRRVFIPGTLNFRDIGGYRTKSREEVAWRRIYRSDCLDSIGESGAEVLKSLGIKTIIDLRSPSEKKGNPFYFKPFKQVTIPLCSDEFDTFYADAYSGMLNMDSLRNEILHINVEILEEQWKSLRKLFRVLQDEDNYPVVIECSSGNLRTGLVTAFLLGALGVSHETIVQDYELSNYYSSVPHVCNIGYSLPEEAQEMVTAVYTSRAENIDDIYDYILERYDGVESYLRHKLGLSQKELKHFRKLMLKPIGE